MTNAVVMRQPMCWLRCQCCFATVGDVSVTHQRHVRRVHWLTQSVLQYPLVLPITLFLNFISLGSLIHLSILSSAVFLNILNLLGQNNGEKEHLWTNVEWTDCFLRTGEYLKLFFFFELCFWKSSIATRYRVCNWMLMVALFAFFSFPLFVED